MRNIFSGKTYSSGAAINNLKLGLYSKSVPEAIISIVALSNAGQLLGLVTLTFDMTGNIHPISPQSMSPLLSSSIPLPHISGVTKAPRQEAPSF